jgi:glycosyltransferase involved in cell wall biosynthesis
MKRISLILPCRNEAQFIGPCLDTLLASRVPAGTLEILVVDGMSDDGTRAVVGRFSARYPGVRLLDNPRRIVPVGLNIGIAAATGEIIVRVDAHALYPSEYLPRLVAALETTDADNVGGRIVTLPQNDSAEAWAIALALSHPFGVGNSYFRIGSDAPRWVETVPFGCWRREVFDRIGGFDEELVRDQDDEFNYRLLRSGGRILLRPDVVSYYFARESLRLTASMMYQYGYFKPLVARKVGRVMTARQLAPPTLILALLAGLVLAPFSRWIALAWGALVALYALAIAAGAFAAGRSRGLRCVVALMPVFPSLHLSYGWGFLRGLWGTRSAVGRWRDPSTMALTR